MNRNHLRQVVKSLKVNEYRKNQIRKRIKHSTVSNEYGIGLCEVLNHSRLIKLDKWQPQVNYGSGDSIVRLPNKVTKVTYGSKQRLTRTQKLLLSAKWTHDYNFVGRESLITPSGKRKKLPNSNTTMFKFNVTNIYPYNIKNN